MLLVISVTVAMIIGSLNSVSALNAPVSYDINNDGNVNIADVVSLNMDLLGN